MKRHLAAWRLARAAERGFTLPELMVSLVAGLVITMAVVGLAKTATTTFHEQVRTTAAEMSLRLASQRLASDLSRAGYMSTGNIRWDPGIARRKEAPDPASDTGSRYVALNHMSALRLYLPGSTQAPLLARETVNSLRPEALDITGNLTSNDQYLGTIGPGSTCGPQRMILNSDDPAVMRILYEADGVTARSIVDAGKVLRDVFLPTFDTDGKAFPARVIDPSGKTHFAVVCDAGVIGSGQAYIEFASAAAGSPVLTGSETGQKGGFDGFEQLQVAPIQTVRWNVQRLVNARLDPADATEAAAKFDLIRQYVAADGSLAGTPEVVAEYIVDFKIGFAIDQSPTIPLSTAFDLDDETNNQLWTTATGVGSTSTARPGPQRIRSVRFRLSDRAAIADRKSDLASAAGYNLRYCVVGTMPGCTSFARVRTLVSEVALMNQARMSY